MRLFRCVSRLLGSTNAKKIQLNSKPVPAKKEMIRIDEPIELKLVGVVSDDSPLEMLAEYCDLFKITLVSKPNINLFPTDIVVKVHDESMIDAGIYDGDYAVIRPCLVVNNGQIALVAAGDGYTLKKFRLTNDGVELHPCNPNHPIQKYRSTTDVRIMGTFVCTCDGEIIE